MQSPLHVDTVTVWGVLITTGIKVIIRVSTAAPSAERPLPQGTVLHKNTILAEVVGEFKKRRLNPPPAQSYAGPGDVSCDFCTGRKFKAVKSCLTCLASYCETHVKLHYEGAAFKRHKLINATGNLEQKLCAEHQKVLEVFCRTDQTCICLLCADKEHRSHDTVSTETERTGKQKQLGETQREIQQRIQERLKEVKELKQAVESLKRSARSEMQKSEKMFTELIRSIEKIHSEVTELIGANEKAAVNQAEGLVKRLEQDIAELRRRNVELKQLSETEDHIHFLQSLCAPPEAGDLPSITVNTDISFGAVRKAVSELKDHIEDFCKRELVKITTRGEYLDCPAGTLSFYGVSDTMTLLHRFQATFTEPLYPGVWVDDDSTVTIRQLKSSVLNPLSFLYTVWVRGMLRCPYGCGIPSGSPGKVTAPAGLTLPSRAGVSPTSTLELLERPAKFIFATCVHAGNRLLQYEQSLQLCQ
ncbi:TRI29 protein, partial [Polyodon spathula]|nr:TRI29 protein [Polyodon spathula]